MYGTGIRLMECLRLRVKDIELERRELDARVLVDDIGPVRGRNVVIGNRQRRIGAADLAA